MKTLFVLLAGILVSPEIAFESQLPLLKEYGDVTSIPYDNNHFDEHVIFDQLHTILTQEKKYDRIFFIGGSFGAMCLLRFFLQEKAIYTKKVAGIILFGSRWFLLMIILAVCVGNCYQHHSYRYLQSVWL